ncbi:MAG TPA: VCBS repeat-containing protein [Bryobacteraceae bacterium]|nr:VCBS repeat-containing protein [Bryobacteraceae bacterium]
MRLAAALLAAACAAWGQVETTTIARDLKGGYQVLAVDMNRDGRKDLVALASSIPELVWYENPGWTRHVIATGFRQMINVAAMDTDGDRIPELLMAHEFSNIAAKSIGTVSLLRSQGDPRQPWSVTEIDRVPTTHRIRVCDGAFVNAPLTDAKAEPPDFHGDVPLVFYRPGEWKPERVEAAGQGVMHGLYIERANPCSMLVASFAGISRIERRGKSWQRTKLADGSPLPWPKSGASDITVGRLKTGKFIASIEPWHGNELAVYTQKGRVWQREVLDSSLIDGHTVLAADFDNDGNDEIVSGARGGGGVVDLHKRTQAGWVKTPLDRSLTAASCEAVDLDGDNRLELVCIGSATAELRLYRFPR